MENSGYSESNILLTPKKKANDTPIKASANDSSSMGLLSNANLCNRAHPTANESSTPKGAVPSASTLYTGWRPGKALPVFGKIVIVRDAVDKNAYIMYNKLCRIGR